MNKNFLVSSFLALTVTLGSSSTWSADTASDTAQVKLQASSLAEIEALTEATGSYKPKDVELNSTAHQMTVTIINSKLNTATVTDREAEANKMVSAIARAIADKPAFSQLPVIHVVYVKRQGRKIVPVQSIDFFKTPAGIFVLHKT